MAYQFTNSKGTDYYLHSTDVILKGSRQHQTIYFFAKKTRSGSLNELPSGYEIVENKRTGLPTLRKVV